VVPAVAVQRVDERLPAAQHGVATLAAPDAGLDELGRERHAVLLQPVDGVPGPPREGPDRSDLGPVLVKREVVVEEVVDAVLDAGFLLHPALRGHDDPARQTRGPADHSLGLGHEDPLCSLLMRGHRCAQTRSAGSDHQHVEVEISCHCTRASPLP
jgi:hypothetical protein